MILSENVNIALALLKENGFKGYLVGGCVRDFIMGKEYDDIDITTDATPTQMMEIFHDFRCIETGIKHGTLTVIINSQHIEITTFRIDGDYFDNRRPDSVEFSKNIEDDLSRRDFTINSIAYNPETGFVDIFGGREDIKNGIIRTVGNADMRFEEDALRILRGLRFNASLGFEIEEDTLISMRKNAHLLKNIANERIYTEVCKTLLGDNVKNTMMNNIEIFGAFIPEILPMYKFDQKNPYHIYDVYEHTLVAVQNCPKNIKVRLALLLHDIGKPEVFTVSEDGIGHFYGHTDNSITLARTVLERFKCDNATKKRVLSLIEFHGTHIVLERPNVKRWLLKLGTECYFDLIEVKRADCIAKIPRVLHRLKELDDLWDLAKDIIASGECFELKSLEINGNDLIKLGYEKGSGIGKLLNFLLQEVIDNRVENTKTALSEYLGYRKPEGV